MKCVRLGPFLVEVIAPRKVRIGGVLNSIEWLLSCSTVGTGVWRDIIDDSGLEQVICQHAERCDSGGDGPAVRVFDQNLPGWPSDRLREDYALAGSAALAQDLLEVVTDFTRGVLVPREFLRQTFLDLRAGRYLERDESDVHTADFEWREALELLVSSLRARDPEALLADWLRQLDALLHEAPEKTWEYIFDFFAQVPATPSECARLTDRALQLLAALPEEARVLRFLPLPDYDEQLGTTVLNRAAPLLRMVDTLRLHDTDLESSTVVEILRVVQATIRHFSLVDWVVPVLCTIDDECHLEQDEWLELFAALSNAGRLERLTLDVGILPLAQIESEWTNLLSSAGSFPRLERLEVVSFISMENAQTARERLEAGERMLHRLRARGSFPKLERVALVSHDCYPASS